MEQTAPKSLYKYCHPDRSDIIRHGRIRFSQLDSVNDPFEINPAILPESKDFHQYTAEIERKNYTRSVISKNWGVLSLSEHAQHLTMWAHYADSHRGFVLELDTTNEFFVGTPETRNIYPLFKVVYTPIRPAMAVEQYEALKYKAKDWEYEAEWRMPKRIENATERWGEIALFDLPLSAVRSVTLGYRTPQAVIQYWMRLLESNPKYGHIKLWLSDPDDTEFKLRRIPLNLLSIKESGIAPFYEKVKQMKAANLKPN